MFIKMTVSHRVRVGARITVFCKENNSPNLLDLSWHSNVSNGWRRKWLRVSNHLNQIKLEEIFNLHTQSEYFLFFISYSLISRSILCILNVNFFSRRRSILERRCQLPWAVCSDRPALFPSDKVLDAELTARGIAFNLSMSSLSCQRILIQFFVRI